MFDYILVLGGFALFVTLLSVFMFFGAERLADWQWNRTPEGKAEAAFLVRHRAIRAFDPSI